MTENNKKTIVLNMPEFLAAVYGFRKAEIGELILHLCEKNLYGISRLKLNERVAEKFEVIQAIVDGYARKYEAIKESRRKSGSKGGKKTQENRKKQLSDQTKSVSIS